MVNAFDLGVSYLKCIELNGSRGKENTLLAIDVMMTLCHCEASGIVYSGFSHDVTRYGKNKAEIIHPPGVFTFVRY